MGVSSERFTKPKSVIIYGYNFLREIDLDKLEKINFRKKRVVGVKIKRELQ